MSRSKVVPKSKFLDAFFYEILRSQWVKNAPPLSPPFLRDDISDRAETFFIHATPYLEMVSIEQKIQQRKVFSAKKMREIHDGENKFPRI